MINPLLSVNAVNFDFIFSQNKKKEKRKKVLFLKIKYLKF